MTKYNSSLTIVIISLILAVSLIKTSQLIISKYYVEHSFYYDPVTSYSKGIELYMRMLEEADKNQIASRLNFAILEFRSNPKTAFFNLPVILFYPKLLATPWSTSIGSFLMIFAFLSTLGLTLKKNEFGLLTIISFLLLACSAPVLYNHFRGISSGWHDLPTGFLFASSIICLINWHENRNAKWLFASALFVSVACVSRSIFAVYAVIAYAPLFIFSSLQYIKSIEIKNAKKWFELSFCAGLFVLIAGVYHFIHFENNFYYYTHFSLTGKVDSIWQSLLCFFNLFHTIGISYVILFGLSMIYLKKYSIVNKSILWLTLYPVLIFPVFWICYYRMGSSANHVMLTIIPYLFILVVLFRKKDLKDKRFTLHTSILGVFILFSIPSAIYSASNSASAVTKIDADTKWMNKTIARELMHLKANENWVAYFDEQYTRISNAEAFYSFQFYPKSKIIFEQLIHQEYIDGAYPNWSEKQILKDQINNLSKLKLIVIFSDQKSLFKGIPNNFSASRRITFGLMKHLEKNSNWTLYKTLHTLKYGNLAFYTRNDS